MHAFEIGHLGCVAGVDQRLVTGLHQLDQAAAQYRLLAEQVGLAFLAERRLDDAGASAADRRPIGETKVVGVARNVAMDCEQAGHAGTALVFRAHRVAGALGGNHHHVEIGARLDQVEVHVEAVREHQGGAILHVGGQVVAVDLGLQLVGCEHHHHVGPLGGLGDLLNGELFALGLLDALRALAQRHRHLLDPGIAQIERMGVTLAAIADDGDLLALDQVQVGVAVVVNTHGRSAPCSICHRCRMRINGKRQRKSSAPYIPSGPRPIATTPVRATSTKPIGSIRLMKLSILSVPPVISKTKLSVVASITRARKASASRSASMRDSPLLRTLTMASSRWSAGPATVMSMTRWIGTMRSTWFLICSITIGVPRVTMVMRERCFSCSVSDTVSESIL